MEEIINTPCYTCNVPIYLPKSVDVLFRSNHKTFYCINGHAQFYTERPSEADLLRRERDRLKQQLAQKDDEIKWQRDNRERTERRLSATRGQVTRLRNRARAGVCPCCNRTFSQLAAHMASQHPNFEAEEPDAENA